MTEYGEEFVSRLGECSAVLELGAYIVNNKSARHHVKSTRYVGVDMQPGPGVDMVARGEDLADLVAEGEFDTVICSDTLEHAKDWRGALRGLWHCLKVGGRACITAPRQPWRYHPYPDDFWRFEPWHWRQIFDGQELLDEHKGRENWGGVIVRKVGPLVNLDEIEVGKVNR